jgi:peptidoglycan/LPS O-acetylase OafA/YrhL
MKLLSTYRVELMGLAMIWIMAHHTLIYFPQFIMLPVSFIIAIGYGGVDIFFLLSGLGLSFSLSNNKNLLVFFKKRVVRIVPIYWLFLGIGNIQNLITAGEFGITSFLLSLFGLHFILYGNLLKFRT